MHTTLPGGKTHRAKTIDDSHSRNRLRHNQKNQLHHLARNNPLQRDPDFHGWGGDEFNLELIDSGTDLSKRRFDTKFMNEHEFVDKSPAAAGPVYVKERPPDGGRGGRKGRQRYCCIYEHIVNLCLDLRFVR